MKNRIILPITCMLVIFMFLSSVLLPGCTEKHNPDYVRQDTVLPLFSVDILDFNDKILAIAIEKEDSNITLTKEGKATISLALRAALISVLNPMLSEMDFENMDVFGDDLEGFFEVYAAGLFPGFSIEDVASGFELIKATLGLSLLGFDFEDPTFAQIANDLKEYKTLPSGLSLPTDKNYGLSLSAPYTIRELESPYSGKYTALYLGQLRENEETFAIMTAQKDDKGNIVGLKLRVEFLSLTIVFGDYSL